MKSQRWDSATLKKIESEFSDILISGDHRRTSQAIDRALELGATPREIYLHLLLPAQREIGKLWEHRSVSISSEHIASEITVAEMARMRTMLKPRELLKYSAVVGVMPEDSHTFGARTAADFLYADGWKVFYFGDNAPVEEILRAVSEKRPELLVLSAILPVKNEILQHLFGELEKLKERPKLILGGYGFYKFRESAGKSKLKIAFVDELSDIEDLARSLVGISVSRYSLEPFLAEVGKRILLTRKMRRMSQQAVADAADLDRTYLSSIENGKQNTTIGALMRIAQALEVPIEELLVGRDLGPS